jgi:hypothetical protein
VHSTIEKRALAELVVLIAGHLAAPTSRKPATMRAFVHPGPAAGLWCSDQTVTRQSTSGRPNPPREPAHVLDITLNVVRCEVDESDGSADRLRTAVRLAPYGVLPSIANVATSNEQPGFPRKQPERPT